MPNKNDDIVKVFVAEAKGNLEASGFTAENLEECNEIIRGYAQAGDPVSRYNIAQVTKFVVEDLLKETDDFLAKLADQKTVSNGEKAQFAVGQNDVEAYIQAKGGTPMRTKIANKYLLVDTVEVAARPYMNFQDLATGRLNFSDMAVSAAREMSKKKIEYICGILNAALKTLGSGAYSSVSDLNDAKMLNPILANFRRQAPNGTRIIGDVGTLDALDGVITKNYAGATGVVEGILNNGTIGKYKGCDVVSFENPIVDSKLTPLLNTKLIYLMAGDISPLKVVNEGSVRVMEQQNIDDESYDMVLRQDFGAAFVFGKYTNLGAIEITG